MNELYIRKSTPSDFDRILEIYAHARKFMAEHGNPDQWKQHKPAIELIEADIRNGNGYVCICNEEVHGVMSFLVGEDPTYKKIIGEWKNDEEYAVVHRIASSSQVRGVGRFMLEWAYSQHRNIRIDTHEDNYVMQELLKKLDATWDTKTTPKRKKFFDTLKDFFD